MNKLKRWMGWILCMLLLVTQSAPVVAAAMFSDIDGHWCQAKIESWVSQGIINGYGDGTFRPSNDITRAEFIKLVNRVFGFTKGKSIKFTDVSSGDWYFADLQIAYNEGYIGGYEDGTVRPQQPITRQEVAKVIASLLSLTENSSSTWTFSDYDNIDTWARGYIGAVADAGIMSGYTSGPYVGAFGGRRNITRAEVVEALWRANEYNADPPVTDLTVTTASHNPSTLTTVKDLYIQYPDDVSVSNLMVLGSIYVDSRLGDRTVTMKNVTCSNNLVIDQGNWVLDSCDIKNMTVGYKGTTVTLKGVTTVATATVTRSATIVQTGLSNNYKGVKSLTISANSTSKITLKGTFDNVYIPTADQNVSLASGKIENMSITGADSEVTLAGGTTLNYVYIGSQCRLIGAGKVVSANVEARNVVMQRVPDTLLGSRTPTYLGDYSLNFLITDAASGKVMSGVTITLDDLNEKGTTSSTGQYKFTKIASGTINYTVAMNGYATIQASVKISSADRVVELSMTPQGSYSAELTVQDSLTKQPLVGATGKITVGTKTQSSLNTTGANGKLWFNNLGSASYTYTISCPGYVTSTPATFTISGKDLTVSSVVSLVPTTLVITAASVTDGKAITNFSVKYPGSDGFVSTTTGSLTIRYLQSSINHSIEIKANGFSNKTQTVVLADQVTNNVKVLMNSDRVHDYRVTVTNGNEDVKDATVTLTNGGWSATVATDASGIAYFASVPEASDYTITVKATNHQSYTGTGITVNGDALNRSTAVRLYTLRSPKITFSYKGEGTSTPISGATVWLVSQTDENIIYKAASPTNSSGTVTLNNVPDGDYFIHCTHTDYSLKADDAEKGAVKFSLGLNNTEKEVEAIEKQITVTLAFQSADYKPYVGANVKLTRISDGQEFEKLTDDGGLAVFALPIGKYRIEIQIAADGQWLPYNIITGGGIIELSADGYTVTIIVGTAITTNNEPVDP